MFFTEHPSFGIVRGFWRGAVPSLVAAITVTQAHLLRLVAAAIAAPAGKTPVISSRRSDHAADLAAA